MPLAKTTPTTQAPVVPPDILELPRLPETLRKLDPESSKEYEDAMLECWSRLIDTVNAISNRIGT
jgi:hypothetical protein